MRKIAVVQRNETTEAEYKANREKAGEYFAKNMAASGFAILDVWVRDFNSRPFKQKLTVLVEMVEESDVVYFVPGWLQDPMCRILHEVAVMLKKTIVEGE